MIKESIWHQGNHFLGRRWWKKLANQHERCIYNEGLEPGVQDISNYERKRQQELNKTLNHEKTHSWKWRHSDSNSTEQGAQPWLPFPSLVAETQAKGLTPVVHHQSYPKKCAPHTSIWGTNGVQMQAQQQCYPGSCTSWRGECICLHFCLQWNHWKFVLLVTCMLANFHSVHLSMLNWRTGSRTQWFAFRGKRLQFLTLLDQAYNCYFQTHQHI